MFVYTHVRAILVRQHRTTGNQAFAVNLTGDSAMETHVNDLSLTPDRSFVYPRYCRYSDKLAPIKAKYPEFAQKMSPRFYDSARFFSEEMLFGR